MRKQIFKFPVLLVMFFTVTIPHVSVTAPEPEAMLDLQMIIAGIKHFDAVVKSANGEFVIKRGTSPEPKKKEYSLVFEGSAFEESRVRIDFHKGGTFVKTKIYNGDRQWEIYERNEMLFQVDVSTTDIDLLNNGKSDLPNVVKQKFKEEDINFFDDFRIHVEEQNRLFRIIDNITGSLYILKHTQNRLEVYRFSEEYGARYQCSMDPQLNPRYWMTYVNAVPNNYLMNPLWKVIEDNESEILQMEILNGEEIYVVLVKHPNAKSLKLWISPEKGFRLVKLERIFDEPNPPSWSELKKGVLYVHERYLEYQEYLPGVWFPEKIEHTLMPLLPADPQIEQDLLGHTILQATKCRLNTDVSFLFQLNIPDETLIFDFGQGKTRPFRELRETSQ